MELIMNAKPAKKKKNTRQSDFERIFLKENRLSDRRMVYVSKDTFEKLVRYISVINDDQYRGVFRQHCITPY